MSADAERAVQTCTHPKVKGSVRALLDAIAKRIPEGETMTAAVAVADWAALTGYDRRTIRTALELLVATGLLRIVGGGRGRVASYEVLMLPGAGADPVLPLIGRARPPAGSLGPTPLFDEPDEQPATEIRAYTVGSFFLCGAANVGSFFLRWRQLAGELVSNIGSFFLRWWIRSVNVGSFFLRSLQLAHGVVTNVGSFFLRTLPLDVDDARARDVHTLKNVHTHTAAAPADAPSAKSPPMIVRHPWHAWCGSVCVPKQLHQAWLDKGHVEAWLFAFYARTCATVSAANARAVVDEFKFWRVTLAAELAPPVAGARAALRPACLYGHDPPCARTADCIARTIAEGKREQTG